MTQESVRIKKISWLFLFLFICAGIMGEAGAASIDLRTVDNFATLRKVQSLIKTNYYKKDLDDKELINGAIKGMLAALNDPYSRYMEPKVFKEMQTETSGEFEGVGIVITIKDKVLTVVSPIDGTPAFKAGITSGDRILKIDGEDTENMALYEAVQKMRGKKGTKVVLTIWREGAKEPKDYEIIRDVIPIQTVSSRMVAEKIGYVRISQFVETTAADLEKELQKLEANKIEGLIVDLRDNPGGLLTAALEVSRKFLPKGAIVTIKSRDGKTFTLYSYYQSHPLYPIVVLINKGSASSSEIVSGALQDNRRAILLGNRSFGKGVIQTVIPLDDGSGVILTTAWYFTPSGRSIHEQGIMPDVWVDLPTLTDEQRVSLYNTQKEGEKKPEEKSKEEKKISKSSGDGSTESTSSSKKKEEPEMTEADRFAKYNVSTYDTQLTRAIDILIASKLLAQTVHEDNLY